MENKWIIIYQESRFEPVDYFVFTGDQDALQDTLRKKFTDEDIDDYISYFLVNNWIDTQIDLNTLDNRE